MSLASDLPPEREPTIAPRGAGPNQRFEIVIEDHGPSISPNIPPTIFEPQYGTKGFGMGLGLPVARRVMALHGGDIEIATEEYRATQVCPWLPSIETHQFMKVEENRC